MKSEDATSASAREPCSVGTGGRSGGGRSASLVLGLVVSIAVAAGAMAGCKSGSKWHDPGPRGTFEQFLMHWFKNERSKAFEMILEEDRRKLTASLEMLETELDGEALPAPDEMLMAGRVDNPYDFKRITAEPKLERKPEAGQSVVLKLEYQDGRRGQAVMQWNGRHWKVDLPIDEGKAGSAEAADSAQDAPGRRQGASSETDTDTGSDSGTGSPDGGDTRDRSDAN